MATSTSRARCWVARRSADRYACVAPISRCRSACPPRSPMPMSSTRTRRARLSGRAVRSEPTRARRWTRTTLAACASASRSSPRVRSSFEAAAANEDLTRGDDLEAEAHAASVVLVHRRARVGSDLTALPDNLARRVLVLDIGIGERGGQALRHRDIGATQAYRSAERRATQQRALDVEVAIHLGDDDAAIGIDSVIELYL